MFGGGGPPGPGGPPVMFGGGNGIVGSGKGIFGGMLGGAGARQYQLCSIRIRVTYDLPDL